MNINKAVIFLDQSEGRVLSVGQAVPMEFWLLNGRPLIEYLVDEAIEIGVEEIVFVGAADKKNVGEYFKQAALIGESDDDWGRFAARYGSVNFSFMAENGTIGAALLKMKSRIKDEPIAIIQGDSLLLGAEGSLVQLKQVMSTADRPVLGLVGSEEASLRFKIEKIADRISKIKEVVPESSDQSLLAFAHRGILTSSVWDVIDEAKKLGDVNGLELMSVISAMIDQGKTVYGYQLKSDWFDLRRRPNWLSVNRILSSRNDE